MITAQERMTVAASHLLANNRVVFAGIGLPLVTAALAKRCHAPGLTVILEGGIIGTNPRPGNFPRSTNEMSAAAGAEMFTGITDIFLLAQRGYFDYGFLGVAQIDPYGNINTSLIGTPDRPTVRLPGSGGANDIMSLCNETLVVTNHEPRRFVEQVDFVTSPGYLGGGDERLAAGLVRGGPRHVVTDLALLDFDPDSKRMRLRAVQAGVSVTDVKEATGFDLAMHEDIGELPEPTEPELATLRMLAAT